MEKESWLQQSITTKREINSVAFSHDLYTSSDIENISSPQESMIIYPSGISPIPKETSLLMDIPKK